MILRTVLWGSIFSFLCGCNNRSSFSGQDLSKGWSYDEAVQFTIPVESDAPQEIYLIVNHSIDYGFQNLYALVDVSGPDNKTYTDTLSIALSDESGLWKGDCRAGVCRYAYSLFQPYLSDSSGSLQLIIHQFSREELLMGIRSIDLNIK
jgi:gliding motility-associated lipoprotein GldH